MILSILPAATMAAAEPSAEIKSTEKAVLQGVNAMRAKHGLVPLRLARSVRYVARARSLSMKNQRYFGHVSPSGVNAAKLLNRRGVGFRSWGEAIGWTVSMSLERGADWMVDWWYHSPPHRKLMLSPTYNYCGVGIVQSGSKRLYTIVFVNQRDHTPPTVGVVGQRNGISVATAEAAGGTKDVKVNWWGRDRRLSVRTSGLLGYTVQFKKIGGKWRTLQVRSRNRQVTKALAAGDYKFRVRAIDKQGNRSKWARVKVYVS